jgi:two-component system chemotaxis response regulator CheY
MSASHINVLLVDDSGTIRRIIRKILGQIGIEKVEEAENGSEALEKLSSESFRLVISDWNMEPIGGLELLKEIRSNDELKHLPFIMVSSNDSTKDVITAKEAGASGYIIKPFTAQNLKFKIQNILKVDFAEPVG